MTENLAADLAALEFANEAFYSAFAAADIAAMEAVWADQPNIFCCHPGWPPITARREVIASWRDILAEGKPIPVTCRAPRSATFGEVGLVCCFERFGPHHFVATNMFLRIAGQWRMIHHHASPVARVPEEVSQELPPSRH